ETELFTMTELAAQYGISRKTAYKWLTRYREDRTRGLHDRSGRPHVSPQTKDADLIDLLVAHRRRHPRWGAKKLLAIAARQRPDLEWPSRATAHTWLKPRGLAVLRPARQGAERPRSGRPRPAAPAVATPPPVAAARDHRGE